jgi:hypothetical protein
VGEGLRESRFRRLEKKLSTLPTLWYFVWRGGGVMSGIVDRSCNFLYYSTDFFTFFKGP